MAGKYEGLSREQLIQLLEKHDRTKKLGLVWERDQIEADRAIDANFVACAIQPTLSDKAAPWRNLVIEGDNFDALRWLRMGFAGRVKCIYIDPPYNTGNKDWVYNDHYVDKEDRYRHSTWLEFLYRRLTLARDLLTEDGVILVSINDDNRAKLEMLMDEALPGMRVGSLVWRSRTGSNADQDNFLSGDHEHILAYGNSSFRFAGTIKSYEMYSNSDNDPRGDWQSDNLTLGFSYVERPNLYYPLENPETGVWQACNPNGVWRYATKSRLKPGQKLQSRSMEEWIERGQILFPNDQRVEIWETREDLLTAIRAGDVPKTGSALLLREDLPDLDFWIGKKVGFGTPRFKRYKADLRNSSQPLSSWITPKSEVVTIEKDTNVIVTGTNDEGAKAVKDVFGEKAFNYAKPPSLIRELIRQASSPGDLVLDFFAGSATTAQAVMELNAEDAGDRRFIMVSSTEASADEPARSLCRDVTAERIRRLNASTDKKFENLSAEFAYLTTRQIAFEDLNLELTGLEVWAALEAMHDLPLTPYVEGQPFQVHESDPLVLVYVDRFDDALVGKLRALGKARRNVFVYAWAPGQIAPELTGLNIEVKPVRETLVKRFQQ
jgi:adenine-specific DNA-methyltransferase